MRHERISSREKVATVGLTPSALLVRKSVSIHITLLAASRLVLSIYTAQQKSKNWKNFLPQHTDVDGIDGLCVFLSSTENFPFFHSFHSLLFALFSFPMLLIRWSFVSSPKRYSVLFFSRGKNQESEWKIPREWKFLHFLSIFLSHRKSRSDTFTRLEGEIACFQLALSSQDWTLSQNSKQMPEVCRQCKYCFYRVGSFFSPSSTESWNECIIASYFWLKSPDSEAFELAMAEEKNGWTFPLFCVESGLSACHTRVLILMISSNRKSSSTCHM